MNIAAAFELVFTTGRVLGDVGQPTYVGYRTDSGVVRNSRPDHVLMSPELFQCVQRSEIKIPDVQSSDHCELSLFFKVKEDAACADWEVGPEHVCGRGMCTSKLSLVWKPEQQQAYIEQLEKNEEMQVQFEDAVDAGNVDTAAFCLRSWIWQAASEHCVDMTKFQTCIFRKNDKGVRRRPVWFDSECKQKRRLFVEAVRSGQAVHACKQLKKSTKNRPGVRSVHM